MTHAQPQKKSFFNMNVDLMHGPILKSLLLFMLPILVSNLFQQLYNTVDTMIVGNVLGDTALAAIGSCGSIYELLVGFGIGIGNGLAIVAARSYGAQDEDLLKRTVVGSVVIGLIASLVITTAGFFGLRPLLELLDTPAEILEDAYSYIIVIDLGVVVMFMYNLCAGLLRAIGNSVMPLVFLLISSVLNVGLDPLLIFVLDMGVAGAALATILSQLASFCMLLLGCSRGGNLRIRLRNVCIRRDLLVDHQIQFTSEVRWAEDLVFNMQYLEYANVLVSIPEAGYYYVQNPQSICHTQINAASLVQNKIQVFHYYTELYTRLGIYEEVRPQLYKFLVDIAESTYPSGPFKEVIDEAKNDVRVVLHFHPALAPFKAAILPLSKKDVLAGPAMELYNELSKEFMVDYDETGSIGKRYRREDEIGTPYCITFDFDTVGDEANGIAADHCVTIRERDSMEQVRIPIDQVKDFLREKCAF